MLKNDINIIRELAHQIAEIAALPQQEQKRNMWRKLNGKQPERPMIMIDQVCWNEMNADGELTLRCEAAALREQELKLRKIFYQWRHFPVDMVVENFISVEKAVTGTQFELGVKDKRLATDASNDIMAHSYINQFKSMDDVEKIKTPVVYHDKDETKRRLDLAHELYDGIIEVREEGVHPYISIWDPLCTWMSVEDALYSMIDEPEMMHEIVRRMVEGYMSIFDQLEEQRLLCAPQSLVHCTGAWTDELPQKVYNPNSPRTKDIWGWGLAQMLSTVSPAMFNEYEIEYSKPLFERFGLMYYGCCDPLEGKMNEVRRIPNLRKVSMSPWVNKERGAMEINSDYVYSCKPNPAFLAFASFDEELVRNDLKETFELCRKYGCPLEFILKDISTVKYEPERLWRWAEIAMEVVSQA